MDYKLYNDARMAVNGVIENKELEIEKLEIEIKELKHTRRMLDEEFKDRVKKKPNYLG